MTVTITLDRDIDLITQREPDRACEAGLTIEVPPGSEIGLAVTATLTAFGDSSFFFPVPWLVVARVMPRCGDLPQPATTGFFGAGRGADPG